MCSIAIGVSVRVSRIQAFLSLVCGWRKLKAPRMKGKQFNNERVPLSFAAYDPIRQALGCQIQRLQELKKKLACRV